jgi:cobalamin-dependent methionine synthase I
VLDAVASVYIEEWLDNQQNLLQRNLGLRYCPGYGILPLSDNRKIADLLEAWRIGVHVTSSDAISPQKTIIGVCPIEEEI